MQEEKDWATATLKEAPFWRNDMQPEEYDIERAHLQLHYYDLQKGTYVPLWKQKLNNSPDYEENYRAAKKLAEEHS